jgi:sugar lactone lactonase YvrE
MGTTATFNIPYGLAIDATGNVYVGDSYNHLIRKISPTGVVSTLAGTAGMPGGVDGSGQTARFYYPRGVAVDTSGHVYVADYYNHSIRKITPAGVVSTLAGTGAPGTLNGTGKTAQFNYPSDVAIDTNGNLYVADTHNHLTRQITPLGVVTTLAGVGGTSGYVEGTAATAQFHSPYGVAVDPSGHVYVADQGNHCIRKITPAGVVTTLGVLEGIIGYADGTSSPSGIATDPSGNVYVADTINNLIRKISPAGVVRTVAGLGGSPSFADGTGAAAQFNNPAGLAFDTSGHLYVADQDNHRIRKITPI